MHSFEYRDPARLIREIAERVPLTSGTAHVALVERPSQSQRLIAVETLDTPALIADHDEALPELRELMEALTIPGSTSPLSHSLMTVVVRPGLCVFGPNEGRWCAAWRYTNHVRDCYSGELILVTEHGWSALMTGCAGHFPALAA